MRTIKQAKQDIANMLKSTVVTAAEHRKLETLKLCLRYLEAEPTEEFVKSEIERVSNKINWILQRKNYEEWLRCHPEYKNEKNPETIYHTEMKLNDFRKQLKTLHYVYGSDLVEEKV